MHIGIHQSVQENTKALIYAFPVCFFSFVSDASNFASLVGSHCNVKEESIGLLQDVLVR